MLTELKKEARKYANPEKAAFFPRFFKTGPGEYGEGDQFIGITVPDQRAIIKKFKDLPEEELIQLLKDPIHEYRLMAVFIMVAQYKKNKERIVNLYLSHTDYINNWDLVDSSAPKILGPWLEDKDRSLLIELAQRNHLWEQRIAIISTLHFIRLGQFDETIVISEMLLNHPHDLIHKAVGWMLREVGKRDKSVLVDFLNKYAHQMPRTMLRYAIEKLEKNEREEYMNLK